MRLPGRQSTLLLLVLLFKVWAARAEPLSTGHRKEAFLGYAEKVAGSACRDKDPSCSDWATKGECEKNAGFMKSSCPVSCKECTPAELHPEQFLGETLIMSTSLGELRVRMLFDNAPRSCALVMDLAHQGACERCNFYRPELAPKEGGGPPYGLLQGSLTGVLKSLPQEGKGLPVKYGNVATIAGADFYIAAMDHSDWGSAHTVWGYVENMEVVERILASMKFHEVKHPVGTIMRMADEPLHFLPGFEKERELR